MSTKIGSSRWICDSGSVWVAETSAPTVNSERPIRPVIGAGTVVNFRLICAVSSAARVCATEAVAWREVAIALV
jgi:hypothetical protein